MADDQPAGTQPDTAAPEQVFDQDGNLKIKDSKGRLVSQKKANKPYLAYQKYREEEAKRLAEKEERKRIRAEKIARGEEVGPEERDDDSWSLWEVVKTLLVLIGMIALTGQLVTGSLTNKTLFSENQLAKYDGTDLTKGVYLASLAHWKKFFAKHEKYRHIGWVQHPAIDPNTPPPVHCDEGRAAADRAEAAKAAAARSASQLPVTSTETPHAGKEEL
ncbi:hypothetical protein FRC10_000635 [Ceratobasidium sp. 414]|nr:hypothetical protein FRC10_000635 [Ceratobasidium sp. 414]